MKKLLAALGALALLAAPAAAGKLTDTTYDAMIKAAVATYWTDGVDDWRLGKAQIYAESRFDTNARSPVGAAGVAQFMKGTWGEVVRQMGRDPLLVPPTFAPAAIDAYAFYMRSLRKQWRGWTGVGGMDGHWSAVAGYNAGSGHILKAWRLCAKAARWEKIVTCLPQVTGRHSVETKTYVTRIMGFRNQLAIDR